MNLNRLLREAIETKFDSVNRLANVSGIPQQVLQRFVSGEQENLRSDTLNKLLPKLGLTVVKATVERDREKVQKDRREAFENVKHRFRVIDAEVNFALNQAMLVEKSVTKKELTSCLSRLSRKCVQLADMVNRL